MEPIGCPETSVPTNQHCLTSYKSKYIIYTTAEARNHATYSLAQVMFGLGLLSQSKRVLYQVFIITLNTPQSFSYHFTLVL